VAASVAEGLRACGEGCGGRVRSVEGAVAAALSCCTRPLRPETKSPCVLPAQRSVWPGHDSPSMSAASTVGRG